MQVLQASVTGLQPKQPYVLALSHQPDGGGILESLAEFTTNPAGSAIVNSLGPIRQVVLGEHDVQRRYLVIVLARRNGWARPFRSRRTRTQPHRLIDNPRESHRTDPIRIPGQALLAR